MNCYICMKTPVAGRSFLIVEDGKGITQTNFLNTAEEQEALAKLTVGMEEKETPLLAEARRQMTEYFEGKRREFDLPLSLHGTPFQLEDWRELCRIPYGETRTYGQVAAAIGRPKACRAVGMANHNNPVSVIVPCHRVIGGNGKLVGYGGGLDIKEALLELEGWTPVKQGKRRASGSGNTKTAPTAEEKQ